MKKSEYIGVSLSGKDTVVFITRQSILPGFLQPVSMKNEAVRGYQKFAEGYTSRNILLAIALCRYIEKNVKKIIGDTSRSDWL